MSFRSLLVALALLSAPALPAQAASPPRPAACAPSVQDRLWMQQALDAWFTTAHDRLSIYAGDPPDFVFFDDRCAYRTGSTASGPVFDGPRYSGRRLAWKATPHGGKVALPGGGEVPAQVVSFAAPYDHDARAFMVMALPSVWRAGDVHSALGLETLMTAVFVHEMTHTRQFYAFAPRLAALTAKYHLGDDLSDDSLQEAFKDNRLVAAAIDHERQLLLAAAAESDDAKARTVVAVAYAHARARMKQVYVGDNAKWGELEDTFLSLEGIAQWAAWSWLTDPRGGGVDPVRALPLFRRGGRYWSQDEGFLVMLAVNRFVPDWRARAFAARPEQILSLWRAAGGVSASSWSN